jgi:hypothetical protein
VKDPGRRGFNLGADLDLLEKEIARLGDVRLVIIDPISSYLGSKVDSHVNASVRGVLEPVSEMAARLRIAFVAITHQPKGTGTAAIHRFIGSVAFVAAARSAHLVISDPEDKDRRLFLPVKNNLAPLGKGLAFRLEQRLVGDPDRAIVASSVVWESEPVTISADQALQAADDRGGGGGAGADAEEFLRDALADGPIAVKDIQTEAKAAGHSWATVRRAKDRLGVIVERDGFGSEGKWLWRLPAPPTTIDAHFPIDAHPQSMSTYGKDEHLWTDENNGEGAPADNGRPEFRTPAPGSNGRPTRPEDQMTDRAEPAVPLPKLQKLPKPVPLRSYWPATAIGRRCSIAIGRLCSGGWLIRLHGRARHDNPKPKYLEAFRERIRKVP